MRRGWAPAAVLGMGVVLALAGAAPAGSLSDGISTAFGELGVEADVDQNATPHRAHFTSSSLATFGLLVEELSSQAADFPAISTVPGFAYRYDPKLEVFEPARGTLGPVYVERARTLGRGKLDFGISYLYADFDEVNGEDLDDLSFTGLVHNDCCSATAPPPSQGNPAFESDTADVFVEKFTLKSHVLNLTGTYGLTPDWDVNVLLPIVHTTVDFRATAQLNNESGTNTHSFDRETGEKTQTRSFDDDATGVGDLQLRTKYHLLESDGANFAAGLSLRLPTGEEDDFQGLGDVTLTPFVAVSHEQGKLDLHASGGIDVNFDDSDRSRIRYGAGISFQLTEGMALLVDVVGSSNLATDNLTVTVPQFVNAPGTSEAEPRTIPGTATFSRSVSTDIIDLAPGLKAVLPWDVVGFVTFFVPLNEDGLRADFIPAGGLQKSF